MKRIALVLAACSSSATPTQRPQTPSAPADAAVDASPDGGPPAAVAAAPAWVFRYHTADRNETWTLRYAEGHALVVVETANGTTQYTGTAVQAATLKLEVATSTAKLGLDCKRNKRSLSAKCNDAKAKPVEVLDCYHPDFKEPMPFGPAPGVEYFVGPGCNGYRLAAP